MASVVFWNLGKNVAALPHLACLAAIHGAGRTQPSLPRLLSLEGLFDEVDVKRGLVAFGIDAAFGGVPLQQSEREPP